MTSTTAPPSRAELAETPVPAAPPPEPSSTLKPRYALKVAVVGNRRFGGETDAEATEAAARMKAHAAWACRLVWEEVAGAMEQTFGSRIGGRDSAGVGGDPAGSPCLRDFFRSDPPLLVVMSGLAAGADQFGVESALALGAGSGLEVRLEAVLPFRESDYPGPAGSPRKEFRADEATLLRGLASQARQVIRLDGSYSTPEDRQRAYRDARGALLQHADLLIAVYDPIASPGAAGTVEAVNEALRADLGVVAVLVSEQEARIAVYPSLDERPTRGQEEWERAFPLTSDGWRSRVNTRVQHLLCLPYQISTESGAGEAEGEAEREGRLKGLDQAVARLRLFYGEAPLHRLSRGHVLGSVLGGAWKLMLWTARKVSASAHSREHASGPPSASDEITAYPYVSYYLRASDLAEKYMRTYRGAFVLSFALAGMAVAAAVALMAWALLEDGHPPPLAIVTLGGLKLAIVVVLLILERASHQARYQEHATDYRYLAELLRPVQWLAPAGAALPAVELPAHAAPLDPRRGWMPWLVRAVFRSTPPVANASEPGEPAPAREVMIDVAFGRSALQRARDQWLQGQVHYHWHNGQRMHHIDYGLERLAKVLLWMVLAFAFVAVVLELLPHFLPELWASRVERLHPLAVVLSAGAAALPAFIAALGGIMFQSEARRLELRSEAMYHGLRIQQEELDRQISAMQSGDQAWGAVQRLRELAAVMLTESGDWKILYQTHEVHAG